MANPLDDAIEALRVTVEAGTTVKASAITFIKGVPALIQAAIDAQAAAGATPAQLALITSLKTKIAAESQEFTDALTTNTPEAPPDAPPV